MPPFERRNAVGRESVVTKGRSTALVRFRMLSSAHAALSPAVIVAVVLVSYVRCGSERRGAPSDSVSTRPPGAAGSSTGTSLAGPLQTADFVIAGISSGADSASV